MLKPRIRGGFSDRNGFEVINQEIQLKDLDERTRNKIINLLDDIYKIVKEEGKTVELKKYIYKDIFVLTQDDIPASFSTMRDEIVHNICSCCWQIEDIFTFIEEVLKWVKINITFDDILYKHANNVFTEECVGYRFAGGIITSITDECELETIEQAINCKYTVCKERISKSMKRLYDREQPDYENSVKESILAVESICNTIMGTDNTELGKALKKIEDSGIKIHPALKEAFIKLYGYTSDENGIRHCGGIDSKTTFEEAQYMLVSCSAFVNYLIENSSKIS